MFRTRPKYCFRLDRLRKISMVILVVTWIFSFLSCEKGSGTARPFLILKTGSNYTVSGTFIPVGGQIRIGVLASGDGAALTYLRIDRITPFDTIIETDKGIYAGSEGLDEDFLFSQDTCQTNLWKVTVMNADRNTAVVTLTTNRGAGTAYGDILYFPSVTLALQNNTGYDHFFDVHTGLTFDMSDVSGHEGEIDMCCYYYVTSGFPSPTFTCPGYTAATGYYPVFTSWTVKNMTLYDYHSTDNDLVSPEAFDSAGNDSLLVAAFNPALVSGNCKYCYTGKVIPFKTADSKYGLIRIIYAEESDTGHIEFAVKIQK